MVIILNEVVSQRERDRGIPDVHVKLNMGQIRFVFLMKYIKVRNLSIIFYWDRVSDLHPFYADPDTDSENTCVSGSGYMP